MPLKASSKAKLKSSAALRVPASATHPAARKPRKPSVRLDEGLTPLPRLFPLEPGFDATRVERELETAFGDLASMRERNPFGNSVKLLALDIGKRLDKASLGFGGIEELVQQLTAQAFEHRAQRLGHYLGERDQRRNEQSLRAVIRLIAGVAGKGRAGLKPFAEFQATVERELFGIVFTAHPTFSQSKPMMRAMAELAMDRDAGGGKLAARERARLIDQARAVEHRPPETLDLAYEHGLSILAIANSQTALRRAYEIVLEVAAELYPADWDKLTPKLVTIASWVGYDLDGRADIKWSDTLFKRLKLQALQLEQYLSVIEAVRAEYPRGKTYVPAPSPRAAGEPVGAGDQGSARRNRRVPGRRPARRGLARGGPPHRQAHA